MAKRYLDYVQSQVPLYYMREELREKMQNIRRSAKDPRFFLRTLAWSGCFSMIRVLEPSAILVYGGEVECDYQGIKVVYYGNHVTDKMQ